jgi:hypothetical protein
LKSNQPATVTGFSLQRAAAKAQISFIASVASGNIGAQAG